jgi:hypothetical protein
MFGSDVVERAAAGEDVSAEVAALAVSEGISLEEAQERLAFAVALARDE